MIRPTTPDPDGLRAALAQAGVPGCEIVADGRLAVIRMAPDAQVDWARMADTAVDLARAAGFTHAALELPPDDAAPVHRD